MRPVRLTFWGLSVINGQDRLARPLGPASQTLLVAIRTHGDEPASREIQNQLGTGMQLGLWPGKE